MRSRILPKRKFLILACFAFIAAILFYFTPKDSLQSNLVSANSLALSAFSDVPVTHPNYEAIKYIQAQNIVDGYPDGTFRPDNLINRAEFTKIIVGAYYKGQFSSENWISGTTANGSNCFPDVGTEWFAPYVCFSKFHKFIAGYPDGTFKPANNLNFAEISKILVTVNGLLVTPYPDPWYKPYVEKLAEVQAIPTSILSFSQSVTRAEMAEMIYRLKAHLTDKPSKTYQQLFDENAALFLKQQQAISSLPIRLKIPVINVDSTIEHVGLTPQGAVGVPKDPANAAWYNLGPLPGEIGSAVITGHVNWYYGATGVFADLHKLQPGDHIIVQDNQGAPISFVVRESRKYAAAADATDVFTSNDGKAHLNLITCDGVWNSQAKQYTQRLVVFADKE